MKKKYYRESIFHLIATLWEIQTLGRFYAFLNNVLFLYTWNTELICRWLIDFLYYCLIKWFCKGVHFLFWRKYKIYGNLWYHTTYYSPSEVKHEFSFLIFLMFLSKKYFFTLEKFVSQLEFSSISKSLCSVWHISWRLS